MDKRILKLLYRSLDSPLKKKDRQRLDKALEESEELRRHKLEIVSMRQAVADGALRSFRPQFAERVMGRIQFASSIKDSLNVQYETFRTVFKRFAVAALIILVVLISYNVAHSDWLPKDEIFYVSDMTINKILQTPVF
jgi:hypothetical protein